MRFDRGIAGSCDTSPKPDEPHVPHLMLGLNAKAGGARESHIRVPSASRRRWLLPDASLSLLVRHAILYHYPFVMQGDVCSARLTRGAKDWFCAIVARSSASRGFS
jgi:hypothetical protein